MVLTRSGGTAEFDQVRTVRDKHDGVVLAGGGQRVRPGGLKVRTERDDVAARGVRGKRDA